MATNDDQRHRMIARAVTQRPDAVVDVTIHLWERLAAELILIIGDGGFESLYSRSLHLTSASFSWMANSPPAQASDSRFAGLRTCLEGQDATAAGEASVALLATFIDILSALIGESLTSSILRSAWGDDALNAAAKETP
ncbi:hypothetical protein ACO0LO_03795 [Undibacterium sp. TJN25]|uniref:hypothetical protein n=1 Tax=Undibacterium sp. TJN25 TaxID=3413056 RepID=UPI003BF212A8